MTDAPSAPVSASDPPRRIVGTRTRAGNAMARTRVGLLEGALRALERYGTRRTTMADIAEHAGVAKATLYNHFRTKEDVWAALVVAQVETLAAGCAEADLATALASAAEWLAGSPAVRRLATDEPAVLVALAGPGDAPGWQAARRAIRDRLARAGRAGDEVVLRWLLSYLFMPGSPEQIAVAAQIVVAGLPADDAPAGA